MGHMDICMIFEQFNHFKRLQVVESHSIKDLQ